MMNILKNCLCLLFSCLLPFWSLAQSPVATRISSGIDLGAGFRSGQISPSLTYYQLLNVTKDRSFSIGWTAAFRTFYASNVDYTTAPAYLRRGGKSGFYALGAPLAPAYIDTLQMPSASATSLNLGARVQFRVSLFEIGASADLLGITLGRSRVGKYTSSSGYYLAETATKVEQAFPFTGDAVNQSARPTVANIQLLGDNAIGTLATEVYGRVKVSQGVGIKVGYQWLSTEYTTSVRNGADGNDRFRSRSGLTYVGLTFFSF